MKMVNISQDQVTEEKLKPPPEKRAIGMIEMFYQSDYLGLYQAVKPVRPNIDLNARLASALAFMRTLADEADGCHIEVAAEVAGSGGATCGDDR